VVAKESAPSSQAADSRCGDAGARNCPTAWSFLFVASAPHTGRPSPRTAANAIGLDLADSQQRTDGGGVIRALGGPSSAVSSVFGVGGVADSTSSYIHISSPSAPSLRPSLHLPRSQANPEPSHSILGPADVLCVLEAIVALWTSLPTAGSSDLLLVPSQRPAPLSKSQHPTVYHHGRRRL
jgi:hypothetical protein